MIEPSATHNFDAIVFDLDGTLVDTVPDSHAALNRVFHEEAMRPLSLDEVRSVVGKGAGYMIRRASELAGRPISAENLKSFERRYLDSYLSDPVGHAIVYPGTVETLRQFSAANVRMGICTNKPKRTTHIVLGKLELSGFFQAVVCPEDVSYCKPDGRHVIATLEALGVAPSRAVFVGDSETDIFAAADAGVMSVMVTWGYSHVPRESLPADISIDRFSELPLALSALAIRRA